MYIFDLKDATGLDSELLQSLLAKKLHKLYHKTFFSCNLFHIVVNKRVFYCLAFPP